MKSVLSEVMVTMWSSPTILCVSYLMLLSPYVVALVVEVMTSAVYSVLLFFYFLNHFALISIRISITLSSSSLLSGSAVTELYLINKFLNCYPQDGVN